MSERKVLIPDPMFLQIGSSITHAAWGGDCPHCKNYWESVGTERETPIECDHCNEEFDVKYPGDPHEPHRSRIYP